MMSTWRPARCLQMHWQRISMLSMVLTPTISTIGIPCAAFLGLTQSLRVFLPVKRYELLSKISLIFRPLTVSFLHRLSSQSISTLLTWFTIGTQSGYFLQSMCLQTIQQRKRRYSQRNRPRLAEFYTTFCALFFVPAHNQTHHCITSCCNILFIEKSKWHHFLTLIIQRLRYTLKPGVCFLIMHLCSGVLQLHNLTVKPMPVLQRAVPLGIFTHPLILSPSDPCCEFTRTSWNSVFISVYCQH